MRNIKISLCLIILFTFQSCNILNKGFSKDKAKISFDYTDDLIFVPVEIQGEKYNFLFDTGSYSVISENVIEEINGKTLISSNDSLKDASGQRKKVEQYNVQNINVGENLNLKEAPFLVSNLNDLSKNLCVQVDGVIGSNVMQVFPKWKIDYRNKEITVFNKKESDLLKEGIPVQLEDNGVLTMNLKIGNKNVIAGLDTGNNSSFSISKNKSDDLNINRRKLIESIGINQTTYYDSQKDTTYLGYFDSLKIGDIQVSNVKYEVGNTFKNLIGNKFLERFGSIIIDYKSQKIFFENQNSKPKVESQFGFSPYYFDGYVLVSKILKDSPATKAGIKLGDTIFSINKKKLYGISNEKWCEIRSELKEKDQEIEIRTISGDNKEEHLVKKYSPFLIIDK